MSRATSTPRSVKRPPTRKRAATPKQQVQQLLREMPEDCTIEDIQYRLYLVEKLRRRTQQADEGDFVSHAEVKRRLAKWLK